MDNQQPHGVPTGAPKRSEPGAPLSPSGAARRRLGLSGVILTLASQPAMAGWAKSPSGTMSGNLSNPAQGEFNCNGLSPGFWRNHTTEWPGGILPNSLVSSYIPCGGELANVTCLQILSYKYKADKHNTVRHLLASLLNVLQSPSGIPEEVLTASIVRAMGQQWDVHRWYVPIPDGEKWEGNTLSKYLQTTYHAADPDEESLPYPPGT